MSPFYGEHTCGVCYRPMTQHESRCDADEAEGESHYHLSPLCCPGCPCGSYEEDHPSTAVANGA